MKILIVGDLHLRAKRLKDVASSWANAINWAHKNGADAILQAGDVFHHANVCGREASTGTVYDSLLAPYGSQEKKVPLYALVGNHDMSSPRDKDALAPLDLYDWIKIIRKPSVVEVPNGNLSICAIPWLERSHLIGRLLAKGMKFDEASSKVNSLISGLMAPLAAETKKHQDAGRFVLFAGHLEVTGAKREGGTVQKNGSFEFSPEELASVGADAYALAHIHIRQHINGLPNQNDGYAGTLCQLSFGEEGNAVGCRLLEIDGRNVVSDRWLDNKNSPRYFTVIDSIATLNYRKGTDYVKLRANTKPDALPEGVLFERLPQAAITKLRTGEKLDADMSLRELLTSWHKIENCKVPIDTLVKEVEKFNATSQVPDEFIGSIERVEGIRLKNLTCHADTDIKLDVQGICGLCGPNGSGKTTAIEAIMLALYGISPSRPIPTLMPKGESIESVVEVDFISNGKKYLAKREFKKTAKTFGHKAYIFEDGVKDAVASSDKDVYNFCCRLVGDSDLVLASIFSSQGDSGNLVKLKPAGRKDLFAKLLGTEKFIALSKAAEKTMAADGAAIIAQKARIEAVRVELSKESEDQKKLADFEKKAREEQECFLDSEEQSKAHKKELAEIEEAERARGAIVSQLAGLEAKKQEIQAEGRTLKLRKAEIDAVDTTKLEDELAALRKDRKHLDDVSEKLTKAREETSTLMQQSSEWQAQAQKLLFERSKAYSDYKIQKNDDLTEFKIKCEKSSLAALEKKNKVSSKLNELKASLEEAKRRTGLLAGFPDLAACRACPLAKDSIESRDGIPEIENRIKKGEEALAKAQKEFDDLNAQIRSKIDAAKQAIVKEPDWQPEVLKQANECGSKAAQCIEKSLKTVPVGLAEQKKELEERVSNISSIEEQIKKVSDAKAEASKIDTLLDVARKNFKEADDQVKAIVVPPEIDKAKKATLKTTIAQIEMSQEHASQQVNGMFAEIGACKARLQQHETRKVEIAKLEGEIKEKADKAEIYQVFVNAFCRDGIPQLIVDSAIPHLNDIMYEMMSECDGKWTIRICSQHANKDGTLKEQIDILVDDGNDERDISTYSGGEKNLLEMVVRIAFSVLQAERSGKSLKVLVLDETMYFADEGHSDAFMRMMTKLQGKGHFNQIFIISHSEYVLSSIQNKIFFSLSNGKSSVQTAFCTVKGT